MNNDKRVDDLMDSPINIHDDLSISIDEIRDGEWPFILSPDYLCPETIKDKATEWIKGKETKYIMLEQAKIEEARSNSNKRMYELIKKKDKSIEEEEELKEKERIFSSPLPIPEPFKFDEELIMEIEKLSKIRKAKFETLTNHLNKIKNKNNITINENKSKKSIKSISHKQPNNIEEEFNPVKKRRIETEEDQSICSSVKASKLMEELQPVENDIPEEILEDFVNIAENNVSELDELGVSPIKYDGKFRLKAKTLFLTYPKCNLTKEFALSKFKEIFGSYELKNYIIGQELHKDNTEHLHAYIELGKTIDISSPNRLNIEGFHGDYRGAKNKFAVMKYVKKGGNFIESFDSKQKEKCHDSKKKFIGQELINGTPLPQLVQEYPELMFEYKKLKENISLYNLDKKAEYQGSRMENLWIYGKSGIGKSQWTARNFPEAYRKDQSKWWDGYQGEETVIIEDMDSNCLGHYLKIWGDHYPCTGEVKGSKIPLSHKRMIITSQYLISDLWKDNRPMVDAIQRRFKTVTVTGTYEEGYNLKEIILQ